MYIECMKARNYFVFLLVFALVFGILPDIATFGAISKTVHGFPRTCIVELETASWCGYCPIAEKALSNLSYEYPEDRLGIISHHYNDSLSQVNSTARIKAYGVVATPTSIFNGNTFVQGGDTQTQEKYDQMIDYHINKKSPFLVHLTGDIQEDHLKLTSYVLGWNAIPAETNFTFIICEDDAKASGRRYSWVCRDVKPEPTGQSFQIDEHSAMKFELNWNIPSNVDYKKVYGIFLIESFDNYEIYQAGIWRRNQFQVENFDTPLGSFFEESPEELKITFSDYKYTNIPKWDLIDQNGLVYPTTGKMVDQTLTIKPASPLPYGSKYCVYIHSGTESLGTSSTFLQSPAFMYFQIGKDPTPEPPPTTPAELSVSTLGIDLGEVSKNSYPEFEFIITNKGGEPLSGNINTDCDWISFDASTFSEVTDNEFVAHGFVDLSRLDAGTEHTCTIIINSDGGDAKIGLKLSIPMIAAVLKVTPEALVFSEENLDEKQTIILENDGQAELFGTIKTTKDWIKIDKDEFDGNSEISVGIQADDLDVGENVGQIIFESNGGEKTVEVTVTIPKKTINVELMYGSKLAVVGGEIVEMNEIPWTTNLGTLMIEINSIPKILGLVVEIKIEDKEITLYNKNLEMESVFRIGNQVALIKYKTGLESPQIMPHPVEIIRGDIYLPFEFVYRMYNMNIDIKISGDSSIKPKPGEYTIEFRSDSKETKINGGTLFIDESIKLFVVGTPFIEVPTACKLFYDDVELEQTGSVYSIQSTQFSYTMTVGSRIINCDGHPKALSNSITRGIDDKIYAPLDFLHILADARVIVKIDGATVYDSNQMRIELVIDSDAALVDENHVELEKAPTIINGRTVVPLRFITETFGFEVIWNGDTKEITLKKDTLEITLKTGEKSVKVKDGGEVKTYTTDPPPTIIDGRTMVPIRFFSEVVSAEIEWIGEERKIILKYSP